MLEGLARIPVEVDLISEFRYRNPILEDGGMVVVDQPVRGNCGYPCRAAGIEETWL